ncbi:MAG: ATP-binding protein [Myxococcales bacterium]
MRGAATALRKGRTDVVPMGYLIGGPVGTGKTFITTCFAGDIGVPCVKFLNFRSQWQGVTEGNLEKIFNLLKAMWPVAVVIDEADAFLGDRNQGGDSGTSNRIFASIASFMGNTEFRGKIIWFLLTCRPDLLPIDLKRQGRAEEHLALFYPQTDPERDELFKVVAKKCGVAVDGIESYSKVVPENLRDCSGADIEAALVRAKFRALLGGREKVTTEDLKAVLTNFIPPSYPMEIELQNLAAVQECTSREAPPRELPQARPGVRHPAHPGAQGATRGAVAAARVHAWLLRRRRKDPPGVPGWWSMPNLCSLVLAGLILTGAPVPARFSWAQARELSQKLHPRSAQELERARSSDQKAESAAAAAELCALGNAGGKACRQAEKQAGSLARRASLL